jgi:hypothetical protein
MKIISILSAIDKEMMLQEFARYFILCGVLSTICVIGGKILNTGDIIIEIMMFVSCMISAYLIFEKPKIILK